jgi:hypothetical protein
LAGVEPASLDLGPKRATVVYDPAAIDAVSIINTLAEAG